MPRRHLDFPDFDAVARDIDHLHSRGCQKVGNWDLAQTCTHLAKAMEWSLTGTTFQGPWVIRKLLGPLFLGRILKKRRMKTGFQAPADLIPSSSQAEEEAVLLAKNTLERMRDHRGDFCPHPYFGKQPSEKIRQLHLIHSAHHLSFLAPQ